MTSARCHNSTRRLLTVVLLLATTGPLATAAGPSTGKKVFMMTDMEGVDGIYDYDLQCNPYKSPRWKESVKLLVDEINAAVDGLLEGGATEVVVCDSHSGGGILPLAEIHPKARMMVGFHSKPSDFAIDPTYSAMIFIGQHPMSGAEKGILAHSNSREWRGVWVNGVPIGEFGMTAFVGASYGVPTIMASGDTAMCKEFFGLVPNGECAEVKSGFNSTSGIMLPHQEACDLIRAKARRALERLPEIKAYKLSEPMEIKIQLDHSLGDTSEREFLSRGAEQLPDWNFVFRGKNYLETYRRWLGK